MPQRFYITENTKLKINEMFNIKRYTLKDGRKYIEIETKGFDKDKIKQQIINDKINLLKILLSTINNQKININENKFIRKFAYFHHKYYYKFKFQLEKNGIVIIYCNLQFDDKWNLLNSQFKTKKIKKEI